MDILFITFLGILAFIGFVCLSGFIAYKTQFIPANSWEGALKMIFLSFGELFKTLLTELTGYVPDSKVLNMSAILTYDEAIEIVKSLDKNPFIAPTLFTYVPNMIDIHWIRIDALKLASQYKDLSNYEIQKMCATVLKNYYLETRKQSPYFLVTVASPTTVEFAIALSEDAMKRLQLQAQTISHFSDSSETLKSEILEEEIDLFD